MLLTKTPNLLIPDITVYGRKDHCKSLRIRAKWLSEALTGGVMHLVEQILNNVLKTWMCAQRQLGFDRSFPIHDLMNVHSRLSDQR